MNKNNEIIFSTKDYVKNILKLSVGSVTSEQIYIFVNNYIMIVSSLNIDKEIFCDLVKFYGEILSLPPLSAKIYGYLIFDFEKKGICFDEFVEVFSASKSSISTNLNLLLNLNLIQDFNKIDERKRFFRINENYFKIRFERIISKMKQEIYILDKLDAFRNESNEVYKERFELYKSLLNKNINNIQETLVKF